MNNLDITRIFQTESKDIFDFFTQAGAAYYIPVYQREYAWDEDNVEQLMEDILSGVYELVENKQTIHFLGTTILCTENDRSKIQPQDSRAIPTRVDNVIDGQQRISTIALLACCLYQNIFEIKQKLPNTMKNPSLDLDGLREAINTYLKSLQEIFSFDLQRGSPERKPIIIRSSSDCWTCEGSESENYQSDVSSYLAQFIKNIFEIENNRNNFFTFENINKNSLVYKNIKKIQSYLTKIEKSYGLNDDCPTAWQILKTVDQSEFWSYERHELYEVINNCGKKSLEELNKNEKNLCSVVQLFAFCHYLFKRCCFTVIRPQSEVRAFDMFQSLNATGTPLTAIETFKPLVVNIFENNKNNFLGSNFDKYFQKIEDLMKNLRSASSKNKRTNDYLNLFALTYDGKSLRKQFSIQRQWLINKFEQQESIDKKENFICQMGQIAKYCKDIIYSENNLKKSLPQLKCLDLSQKNTSSICLLYLKEANHKMADTILSRFYSQAISSELKIREDDRENLVNYATEEFAVACQVVAAFFTLWRSTLENKGLDDVYRELLKNKMSWEKGDKFLTTKELKTYFRDVLKKENIGTKENWKSKAIDYLKYDNVQKVCKFALFVTSNDTISDPKELGLMKKGTDGSSISYLDPNKWIKELSSIEHIAPQNPNNNNTWDKHLYENDNYQLIGNLTLLPTSINISASNKNWLEKWFYYQHLGETDPDKLKTIKQKAKEKRIKLNDSTIQLLQEAKHAHHIKSIIEVGETGNWDLSLVKKRTERICDILWDRMSAWLDLD
ncbi:DUF262 domain-containing protein [Cyanobacterium stanieri LEGE 03274]|uniref:DUF262 domain-containing protein n=1 Tax=Cyanobacterium stanieri LEGE 03274 TaxID=1828756 RepID=A0ABR9V4I9_9CHRO|nr:DUF262 domain-containing HNH endonuclease family protein [Cyanobacterium stanieri]MBE9222809.1 DUF262 domain-containing protein [Cyanobacterium stanieri LEGE 03274]